MARLRRATYSLMVCLLPATATAIGIIVLAQIPTVVELIGLALIVAAVAAHRDPTGEEPLAPRSRVAADGRRPEAHA